MKITAKIGMWGIILGLAIPGIASAEWTRPASWATAAFGTSEYWCKWTFEVNQKHKHMVGNQYVLNPPPEVFKAVVLEAVEKRDTYISMSAPLEIREDAKTHMDYFDKLAKWGNANNWNLQPPGGPIPSEAEMAANGRIHKYQMDRCGLSPIPFNPPK